MLELPTKLENVIFLWGEPHHVFDRLSEVAGNEKTNIVNIGQFAQQGGEKAYDLLKRYINKSHSLDGVTVFANFKGLIDRDLLHMFLSYVQYNNINGDKRIIITGSTRKLLNIFTGPIQVIEASYFTYDEITAFLERTGYEHYAYTFLGLSLSEISAIMKQFKSGDAKSIKAKVLQQVNRRNV